MHHFKLSAQRYTNTQTLISYTKSKRPSTLKHTSQSPYEHKRESFFLKKKQIEKGMIGESRPLYNWFAG